MRKLSTVNTARVYDTVTRPVWFVDILFSTPLYFSSRGAFTYNGISYVAAGLEVDVRAKSISLFNTNFAYSAAFLAGEIGASVNIYQVYGDTTFVAGDADLVLSGEVGQITIGNKIKIEVRESAPRKFPRIYPVAPTFNFIPPDGTEIYTTNGTYILESK